MRVLAIIAAFAFAAPLGAQPLYTRQPGHSTASLMVAAERAWQAAEREKDPVKAIVLWQAAAVAFERAAPVGKREAIYAAVLAWKNADGLDHHSDSKQLSRNQAGILRTMSAYLPFADADELPGFLFLRANILRKHGHEAEAIAGFIAIIEHHPAHETAEYAANLLLDTLNQLGRHDELAAWVDKMRANAVLLDKRDDLAQLLDRAHYTVLRKRGDALEHAGDFARCAIAYRAAHAQHPKLDARGEALYNAGICYERAGATADALAAFREVPRTSPIAEMAHARAAQLRP
jgi:tetratricopeptide (TPR) repeat protein